MEEYLRKVSAMLFIIGLMNSVLICQKKKPLASPVGVNCAPPNTVINLEDDLEKILNIYEPGEEI